MYNIVYKKVVKSLKNLNNEWSRVAKININKWFKAYEGDNYIRYKYYNNIGYPDKGSAEAAIPQDLKDVLIVREDHGKSYILINKKEVIDKRKKDS